jgi:hypothetical protein
MKPLRWRLSLALRQNGKKRSSASKLRNRRAAARRALELIRVVTEGMWVT